MYLENWKPPDQSNCRGILNQLIKTVFFFSWGSYSKQFWSRNGFVSFHFSRQFLISWRSYSNSFGYGTACCGSPGNFLISWGSYSKQFWSRNGFVSFHFSRQFLVRWRSYSKQFCLHHGRLAPQAAQIWVISFKYSF